MRFLVACPECHRQFDATARPVGSAFPCSCGATVTVPLPDAHDAAVVRCSSCGAPREGMAAACRSAPPSSPSTTAISTPSAPAAWRG